MVVENFKKLFGAKTHGTESSGDCEETVPRYVHNGQQSPIDMSIRLVMESLNVNYLDEIFKTEPEIY